MNAGTEKTIFWYRDEVVVFNDLIFPDNFATSANFKYLYCPCLWDGRKYGHFAQTEGFKVYWADQPADIECPKDFRLALLLMGFTP